jgi:hypothetical protein
VLGTMAFIAVMVLAGVAIGIVVRVAEWILR